MKRTLHVIDFDNLHGSRIRNFAGARERLKLYLVQAEYNFDNDFVLCGHTKGVDREALRQIFTELNLGEGSRLFIEPLHDEPQAVDLALFAALNGVAGAQGSQGKLDAASFQKAIVCSGDKDFIQHAQFLQGLGASVIFMIPPRKRVSRELKRTGFPLRYVKEPRQEQKVPSKPVDNLGTKFSLQFETFAVNVELYDVHFHADGMTFGVPLDSLNALKIQSGAMRPLGKPILSGSSPTILTTQADRTVALVEDLKRASKVIEDAAKGAQAAQDRIQEKNAELESVSSAIVRNNDFDLYLKLLARHFETEVQDLAWALGLSLEQVFATIESADPQAANVARLPSVLSSLISYAQGDQDADFQSFWKRTSQTFDPFDGQRLADFDSEASAIDQSEKASLGHLQTLESELTQDLSSLNGELIQLNLIETEKTREVRELAIQLSESMMARLAEVGIFCMPGSTSEEVINEIYGRFQSKEITVREYERVMQSFSNPASPELMRMVVSQNLIAFEKGVKACCRKKETNCACDEVSSARQELGIRYNLSWKSWTKVLRSRAEYCWPFIDQTPAELIKTLAGYLHQPTLMSHFLDAMMFPLAATEPSALSKRLNVPAQLTTEEERTLNLYLMQHFDTNRADVAQVLLTHHPVFSQGTIYDVMFWVASMNRWFGPDDAASAFVKLSLRYSGKFQEDEKQS